MGKFQYAPGLPGYGTQGADGTDGLLGLAIYFSELDGLSQSATIKNRLDNNQVLTAAGGDLPGSPTRTYQTGDIFVDINGKVYEIDFSQIDNYLDTGSRLNTSTIFIEGVDTSTDVQYSRYYNSYLTNQFTVDNVYSAVGVGDYTQNPNSTAGIYGIPAINFGQIKYVDLSIGSYYPFTIWNTSIDTNKPEEAIALVKEYSSNTWRWGNYNTNTSGIRDVSIYFDFSKIIASGNVDIDGSLSVSNIYSESNLSIISSDGETYENGSNINILAGDGGEGDGISNPGTAGVIFIRGGDGGLTTGSNSPKIGGDVSIYAGAGGEATGSGFNGAKGGSIRISGGIGGIGGTLQGGDGGDTIIRGGSGGSALTSGTGGDVFLWGGTSQSGSWNSNEGDIFLGTDTGGTSQRGQVLLAHGTSSKPGIAFAGDLNTGFYRESSDIIGVSGGLSIPDGSLIAPYHDGGTTWVLTGSEQISIFSDSIGLPSFSGDVNINSNNAYKLYLRHNNTSSTSAGILIECNSDGNSVPIRTISGTSSGTNYIQRFLRGVTEVGNITHNGTNTTYGTSSDARLKDNIRDASIDAVKFLMDVSVREWEWKSNAKQDIGFIAQEALDYYPDMVQVPSDPSEGTYGVGTHHLIPFLVKAIQEQQIVIENLKSRLETLESK